MSGQLMRLAAHGFYQLVIGLSLATE